MVQKLGAVVGVDKVLQMHLRALLMGRGYKGVSKFVSDGVLSLRISKQYRCPTWRFCGIIFNSITLTFCFFLGV